MREKREKLVMIATIFVIFVVAVLAFYSNSLKIPLIKEISIFSQEHQQYRAVPNEEGKMEGTQGMQGMPGMQHESVTEDQIQEDRSTPGFVGVEISPERQQLIGVKTEEVIPRKLVRNIRTVGIIEADERKIAHVHVKFDGWIKDMFVYEGKYVKHGDPLFTIYSPELVSSQEEYLVALKAKDVLDGSSFPEISSGASSLLEAARRRFHHWDISEHELKMIEQTGKPLHYMTVHSHMNGYITERKFFPGMHVAEHEDVLVLTDLSSVWALADIYEYELPLVKEGQEATLELSYYPGETFTGKVMYVYPTLDTRTRTAKVRLEFPNPNTKLKPGMYANVMLQSYIGEKLSVAEDSVIDTGERKLVFVASGDGYFEPREIKVGQKADQYYEVLGGLQEGERVVRDAVFLIDSESRLKAALETFSGHRHETIAVGESEMNGKGDVKISFSTNPSPPQSGNTSFKFKLTDPKGKPITDAMVKFTIIMPAMPGMAEMRSSADTEHVGNGVYVGELNIPVSGSWNLVVETRKPGEPPVKESFNINVK
ncbi:MAG TPA: efflux RND transporter periplasmic adaptor subunit [Thermodesulfobacteriota bacterium]|nr:efflux RND transporter periplasmic adaptor subunit [Thermodesulfobacteriota bacterium]